MKTMQHIADGENATKKNFSDLTYRLMQRYYLRNAVLLMRVFFFFYVTIVFTGCTGGGIEEPEQDEEDEITLEYLADESGLPNTYINDIAIGTYGDVLIATNGGLAVISDSIITSYDQESPLPNLEVICVALDALDRVWVGTESGAARLSPSGEWRVYGLQDGLAGPIVYDILCDNIGRLWLSTNGGLNMVDGDSLVTVTDNEIAGNAIYASAVNWMNTLWFATNEGVKTFNDSVWVTLADEDQPSGTIRVLERDFTGNILVGTSEGFFIWNGERLSRYTEEQSLSGNDVRDIAPDGRSGYWIATANGLDRMRVSAEGFSIETIQTQIGDLGYNTVAVDRRGRLWFGTPLGVGIREWSIP